MSIQALQTKIGVKADGDFGPTSFRAACKFFNLTPERGAHFFGQTEHETGGFKLFVENLNYSADGLKKIFPKYFPGNLADMYARQPEKIANRVYANRMGNGDEKSGDGFKFRGRGGLQTTGKDNYTLFAQYIKKPEIISTPDLVATSYAFESAIFFFDKNNLWSICDKGVTDSTILTLTKKINGGINGLDDRILKTKKYYSFV